MNFNFSWNEKKVKSDVVNNYKNITEQFCKTYYSTYDSDFTNLRKFYKQNSLFTFAGEEFVGFDKLLNRVHNSGIHKFTHNNLSIDAQPFGDRCILINVFGRVSINYLVRSFPFVETLVIMKDINNSFYVYNTMFKILN